MEKRKVGKSGCFQISEKLYGREKDMKTFMDAFDRVYFKDSEMFFIAGSSGIGKMAGTEFEIQDPAEFKIALTLFLKYFHIKL